MSHNGSQGFGGCSKDLLLEITSGVLLRQMGWVRVVRNILHRSWKMHGDWWGSIDVPIVLGNEFLAGGKGILGSLVQGT